MPMLSIIYQAIISNLRTVRTEIWGFSIKLTTILQDKACWRVFFPLKFERYTGQTFWVKQPPEIFYKKGALKLWQSLQENTCPRVYFLMTLQAAAHSFLINFKTWICLSKNYLVFASILQLINPWSLTSMLWLC